MHNAQEPEVIYLIATSGHPNLGDELITAAWLRFLAERRPDAEVWLDCPKPGLASHFFGGMHPGLRTTDIVWRVIWETAGMSPEEGFAHVEHRMRHLGTPSYDIGILGARRATTVHVLGGAYINAVWPHHEGLLRAANVLKELSGARTAATGLALIPSANPERVREELASFDEASARDSKSAELAGVELAADDSMLGLGHLPGYTTQAAQALPDSADVWVCIQRDFADEGVFEDVVAAARNFLADPGLTGRTVHYLEAMPGEDRYAYDLLSDLIPEENFVSFLELWNEGLPAEAGQLWFTTRYHLHLLAAACGAAGVAVDINDSYRVMHDSLLEAGTGWTLAGRGEAGAKAPSLDPQFRVTGARMRRQKEAEADRIYPRRPVVAPPPVAAVPEDRGNRARRRR